MLIILLCGAGFALILGEYLLLAWYPEWLGQFKMSIGLLEEINRIMPFLRLGTPLLYALALMSLQTDPIRQGQDGIFPIKVSIWGGILCAILCLLGILFIWQLPTMSRISWRYGYPVAMLVIGLTLPSLISALMPQRNWGIETPKKKLENKLSFNLRLHNGWVNILDPQRGILCIGGPGSGKTFSVVVSIIMQAIKKDYTGIIYDFKFPNLARVAYTQLLAAKRDITLYVINFTDLSRSHRVNPLEPGNMPSIAYAQEYAQAIIFNLIPESIIRLDFWLRSAVALLTAVIWFLKKHHPRQCTLPHAIALICHKDHERLLKLLESDPETAGLIASLMVAIENEAGRQLAGVLATIQTSLAKLNTPEIAWVMSESDFDLEVNDPKDKKLLVVGNDPDLPDALAPVVSLIITAALKRMNRPGRHQSIVMLDEAPTTHIPNLELIPATGRSNKIATVYVAQDISQIVKRMGQTQADVLLGTLSTQLFGKASNHKTAAYVSSMFGKAEKEIITRHQNRRNNSAKSQSSLSFQEREMSRLKPQEVIDLSLGEFVGISVGKKNQWFRGIIKRKKGTYEPLPVFVTGFDTERNFERIHHEAQVILGL